MPQQVTFLPVPALPGAPCLGKATSHGWRERPGRAGQEGYSLIDSVLKLILVPLTPPALVLAMTWTE